MSASPLLAILLLIAGLRWNLIRTGLAVWCLTLALAAAAFEAGSATLAVSQAKALLLALDVLPIVWGALLFYSVCSEAGIIRAVGDGLADAVPRKSLRGLLLAWAFASFLQGAGGFGVPVVVTAPLMVASGFSPIHAVVLPFLGHGWAVTFGSLGASFQALMSASGLGCEALAAPSAAVLGILCLLTGFLIGASVAAKGEFLRLSPVILLAGSAMAGMQYFLAASGFWQMASLGGGLVGILVLLAAGRLMRGRDAPAPGKRDSKFLMGLSGYVLLAAIVLCARWIGPLRDALESWQMRFSLPAAATALGHETAAGEVLRIAPLAHPGTLLLYASLAVFLAFSARRWYPPDAAGKILRTTFGRALPASAGILLMTGISTMLSYSGMTARLADGLAATLGAAFPACAPWLGAAGAFLAGSNTNSNLLFAPLQQQVARTIGAEEKILLAAQTAGGAVGSVLSPAKVGVGTAAAGVSLREGDVIRRLLIPAALLLTAASGFAVFLG
ncbi:MAG: L-lactate permease [Anaerolineales bacterium]|nr:L-lactate permease [Anaerolineales bacterium]